MSLIYSSFSLLPVPVRRRPVSQQWPTRPSTVRLHLYYPRSLLILFQSEWLLVFLLKTNHTHSSHPLHCFCMEFFSPSYKMMFLLNPSSGICLSVTLSLKSILTFLFRQSIHHYLTYCILHLYCLFVFVFMFPIIRKKVHASKEFYLFYLSYLLLCPPAPRREPGIQ